MKRLFDAHYVGGYTAALQDVLNVIDSVQSDLKRHKLKNNKETYKAIVDCMLKNRAILRENPDAFVRYNGVTKEFEVYIQKS